MDCSYPAGFRGSGESGYRPGPACAELLSEAVYGLPEQVFPILFEHPQYDIMVATTKLSQFVTARYAPADAWKHIWRMILGWLSPGKKNFNLKWMQTVYPSYDREDKIPDDVELQAFRRGSEWFKNSRLLVHHSYKDEIVRRQQNHRDGVASAPDWPVGDGKDGILEGYSSFIYHDGDECEQGTSSANRPKCVIEFVPKRYDGPLPWIEKH